MTREIISLHIGQAGVQMGSATWELLCQEHNIQPDGKRESDNSDKAFTTFFEDTPSGQYVPRALFCDLESSVIDGVRDGKYKELFSPKSFSCGKEDAANNFARGKYTEGKSTLESTKDSLNRMVEACDNVQSLMVTYSCAGGTGSGYTSLIMESIYDEFKKKLVFGVNVYPSFKISTSLVEPYNSILGTHSCHSTFSICMPIDNEAVYDICTKQLDIKSPSYDELNRVISQVMSAMTVSCRFPGLLNTDLNEFVTNLVPYPDRHYVISGFSPMMSKKKSTHERITCQLITSSVLSQQNRMIKCDILKGISCGSMFLYRGNVNQNEVTEVLNKIGTDKKYFPQIAPYTPCAFKIGLNDKPITTVENSAMSPSDKAVAVLMNNSSIVELWNNIIHNFNLMYKKRAFVHWFVGEGLEEEEFSIALEKVQSLVQSHLDDS